MNKISSKQIITSDLSNDAIINDEFKGFAEDYLVIHCLLKKWNPKTIFEIGTNHGRGTKIMQNASKNSKIFTLDIESYNREWIDFDCVKLIGDSTNFDYSPYYPIEAWFIDGDHTYENVYKETEEAIKSDADYIIYHDSDIDQVYSGIVDSFKSFDTNNKWELYRVEDTRIAYAIKK
jgi:cephalosporin hydroxylase